MEPSILNSVKQNLGIGEENEAFDQDVIMFTNTAFSTLNDLGQGPTEGFFIENEDLSWDDFLEPGDTLNMVKTFVYLTVRMLFDPPATSFAIAAFEKQIEQYAWRLNVRREGTMWVDPREETEIEEVG